MRTASLTVCVMGPTVLCSQYPSQGVLHLRVYWYNAQWSGVEWQDLTKGTTHYQISASESTSNDMLSNLAIKMIGKTFKLLRSPQC